jgi:lysophospholipase L1-like esterase
MTIEGGERASLAPPASAGDPLVVWFFGGSAMYGFGQRDEHTIPSELVRRAGADGVALEVHNFGTPAYVNWQGTSLFAQLLTERDPPDVAVFYDGYNDISMQLVDGPVIEPSHVLARVQQERIESTPVVEQAPSSADVRAWWADHSATVNLYRRLQDRFDGDDEPEVQLTEAEASAVPADVDPAVVEADTAELLGRGRAFAAALGEAHGVDVQFWFQPTLYTKGAVEGEEHLLERAANRSPAWEPVIDGLRAGFPPEVVDLADSLDGWPDPLFWDTVHTNETGARLIAEAAWPALQASLAGREGDH